MFYNDWEDHSVSKLHIFFVKNDTITATNSATECCLVLILHQDLVGYSNMRMKKIIFLGVVNLSIKDFWND